MRKLISVIFVSFIFLAGIKGIHAQIANESLVSLASPYKKVVRKFTKKAALYSWQDLGAKFEWFATYHSPEFIQAVEKEFNRLYPEGQEGLAAVLEKKVEESPQTEFFISLYAHNRGLKKMFGDQNLWDISLLVGNEVIKPSLVEGVTITPFQTKFYPYINKWSLGFRVIFPYNFQASNESQMVLQLSSVAGTSRLNFKK